MKCGSDNSRDRLVNSVALAVLALCCVNATPAQEPVAAGPPSEIEQLVSAEADIQELSSNWRDRDLLTYRALRKLKGILQKNPETTYRVQIQEDLKPVYEILGARSLSLAVFFIDRHKTTGRNLYLKGARSRLLLIAREYPTFSKMDEVLFRLSILETGLERPDDAAKYLGLLVCDYPNSNYAASAFQQLSETGTNKWEGCGNIKP